MKNIEMNGSLLKELREKKGLTQLQLSKETGVPLGTIGRIESKKDEVIKKVDVLNAFTKFFNNEYKSEDLNDGIPMYNFPASASNIEMYGDSNDVKVVGYLNIPGASKYSFALPVYGSSMYPTLENGVWGVVRPIENKESILWGEIYYIEWGDYRNYKRLLLGDNTDEVILWSDNQAEKIGDRAKYAPIVIKKEDIRRLCLLTDILKKPNY